MGIEIDTSEVRALASRVATAGGRIGAKAATATRAAAAGIEADAKSLAPVGATGDLRDSISASVTGDGRTGAMAVEVGPTMPYGRFVEYGTSVMPAQPFLGPAFDRREPLYLASLARIAEEELL